MADSITIPLSKSQRSDLLDFARIGSGKLGQALSGVSQRWETAMTPVDLADGLRDFITDLPDPEPIVRILIGLRLIGIQSNLNTDKVSEAAFDSLKTDDTPSDSYEDAEHLVPLLKIYLAEPAIRRVAMVVNLSYEHTNLLRSARILTEIRPIFNDQADDVDASVVSYTLRLLYTNAEGESSASIALDHSDVLQLAEQCNRALQKASVLHSQMNAKGIRTVISGNTQTNHPHE